MRLLLVLALLFVPRTAASESFAMYVPQNLKIAQRTARPSADEVIRHASSYLGVRYVWGSCEQPPGFDCSGFMIRVWAEMGYGLPRVSRMQALVGQRVAPDKLEPADLLFFTTDPATGPITHVGMYIGKGEFIHAAMGSHKVTVNSLTGYFRSRFSHARRILPLGPGYVVEADQDQPIGKADLDKLLPRPAPPPKALPPQPPSKKEKEEADKMLADVVLPETGVTVPDWDEVKIGDTVIEDADLANQLRGVDTNDPNQFEHAGQEPPPFFVLSTDPFAGAALPQGPRHLAREEHAVSLHTGGSTYLPATGPQRAAFYLSPELNLRFENTPLRFNVAFPVPWVLAGGGLDASFGFLWASTPGAWRDYTRVLRLAQYGVEEEALYLALNRFATTTIGHGHLLRNVSPSLASPYLPGAEFGHVPLTWHGDLNLAGASIETAVDDVLDPRLIAARVGLRPWSLLATRTHSDLLRDTTFSLEYAVDLGPGRTRPATNMLGTDVDTPVWKTRVHQTDVYAGIAFAVTGGATAPALGMGKGTLGTLWRFRLGDTAAHALRARLELGFGRARDTWIDNFEYAGFVRSPASLSTLVSAGYSFREFFELGATYVPAMPPSFSVTPADTAHKLEAHLGLQNVPIDPKVRLNLQLLHQLLYHTDRTVPDAHYLLADVHLIAVRFLKAGVSVRKPLSADFIRWDVMADLAAEIPF